MLRILSRILCNSSFVMALSEFEIIVGGLTSIPVVAGIFFLVEKTYGSRIYLTKPGKASAAAKPAASKPAASKSVASKPAASKSASSKPAAAKPTVSKPKDGSSVQPSSTKNGSAN